MLSQVLQGFAFTGVATLVGLIAAGLLVAALRGAVHRMPVAGAAGSVDSPADGALVWADWTRPAGLTHAGRADRADRPE